MILPNNLSYKRISQLGVSEKYIRRKHYNSIKVWWARRPIRAMRALLIKEIIKSEEIPDNLIEEINPTNNELPDFQRKHNTAKLKVLDCFSGGGSIPFESARLGCETWSVELNPVAALMQRSIFNSMGWKEYPSALRREGGEIIQQLKKKYAHLFELENFTINTLFWGRTVVCPNCHKTVSLNRLKFLRKKKDFILYHEDKKGRIIVFNDIPEQRKSGRKNAFKCQACNYDLSFDFIKQYCKEKTLDHELLVLSYYDKKRKSYTIADRAINSQLNKKNAFIKRELIQLDNWLPNGEVLLKTGIINPTLYDLKKAHNFFNKRQLLLLLALIKEICDGYPTMINAYGKENAERLILGLTALVEFLVDWNSTGTMWIPQNEQSGRSLAGPGVPMKWDYVEINPFADKGANFSSKLNRVCDSLEAIQFDNNIHLINASATNLKIKTASIDIVMTDPPYYDSIDYTALSEFFRPWFEQLIRRTYDPKVNLKNNLDLEAIASLAGNSRDLRSEEHYVNIMSEVLCEVHRVMKQDGKLLLLYSHKSLTGWRAVARAFKNAGLFISSCHPIDMERSARPRSIEAKALNGVVLLKAKKTIKNINSIEYDLTQLQNELDTSEIVPEQIGIYLASLACKNYLMSSNEFDHCYRQVIRIYEELMLDKSDSDYSEAVEMLNFIR